MSWFSAEKHVLGWFVNPRWGWTPVGPYFYTSTPCRVSRGPQGDDSVWIIRRRNSANTGWQYALIYVNSYRTVVRGAPAGYGKAAITVGEPLHDADNVMAVAEWGSRKKAVETLAKY